MGWRAGLVACDGARSVWREGLPGGVLLQARHSCDLRVQFGSDYVYFAVVDHVVLYCACRSGSSRLHSPS